MFEKEMWDFGTKPLNLIAWDKMKPMRDIE